MTTELSANDRTGRTGRNDLDTTRRVVVGLSGGVDSAVGAHLLRERGYDVQALFMKNWEEDDAAGYCAATEDLADAQRVCDRLKIPLRTVNLASEYWDRVFTHFLAEYQALRTPNPDVLCNREIKFRAFLDFALELGADVIATGHYARIGDGGDDFRLLKGRDPNKDQSYFLHTLGQGQLRRSLFPLGELTKDEVRHLARRAGLANHAKKDSTGICFIGERPFKAFLQRYLEPRPGPIETPEGESVGEHEGLWYFTLGQRQGLNIGGRAGGNGEPWYVVAKAPERDTLIVAQGHDHPLLYSRRLSAIDLHWVREPPAIPMSCRAKTRYRQADQGCCITDFDGESCRVEFEQPQWAVTPGQSVVFYQGDECLGGGVIQATERESGAQN